MKNITEPQSRAGVTFLNATDFVLFRIENYNNVSRDDF